MSDKVEIGEVAGYNKDTATASQCLDLININQAYQRLFSSPDGKLVLNDILHQSNFFGVPLMGTDFNSAEELLHLNGMRVVARDILDKVQLSVDDMAGLYQLYDLMKQKQSEQNV